VTDDKMTLPDRLSTNPRSPHYNEELLKRDIGVRFDGKEKTNVEEYCISVEPYFRDEEKEEKKTD
jgi:hypothetical protein